MVYWPETETPTRVGSSGVVSLVVFAEMDAVAEVWKNFQQHADCTVFQAFGWLHQWQHHVGVHRKSTPVIVLGLDHSKQPLFVLPLAIEKRGSFRRLTWLGSELCDYNAPLLNTNFCDRVTPDDFGPLWQYVISAIRAESQFQFDLVDLDKMPEKVATQKNPFLSLPVMHRTYGAHVATLGKDWNEFFLSKRSGETRKRERRQFKHLAEHGEVRFVDVRIQDDIDRTLKLLIEQKVSSYARMGVENIFARPGYLDFFRAIVADPNLRDVIHLSRIDVGETPVATGLGLRFKSCYYLILSSYQDGALARFGPGRAHLQEMMRYATEHRFDRFDFTIGDEPYKRDWCDIEIKLFSYVEAATMKGQYIAATKTALHRAEHFVTRRPALRRVAKGVAAALALTAD